MTKPFLLYNNLAELCDAVVIMMGAGAFRGTGDTSNEQDAEGSDVEGEELYVEWAGSEDWDIEEPMVCLLGSSLNHCPFLTHAILFQTSVGMTPTLEFCPWKTPGP